MTSDPPADDGAADDRRRPPVRPRGPGRSTCAAVERVRGTHRTAGHHRGRRRRHPGHPLHRRRRPQNPTRPTPEKGAGEGHRTAAVGRPGHPQGLGQPDRLGRPAQRRLLTARRLHHPAVLARAPRRRRRTRRPLAVLDPHDDHRRNSPRTAATPASPPGTTGGSGPACAALKSGHYRTTNCRDHHQTERLTAAPTDRALLPACRSAR